jgi:hypothetical protein
MRKKKEDEISNIKIAIGTSIGKNKQYCLPILAKTLPMLSENYQTDTILVYDGLEYSNDLGANTIYIDEDAVSENETRYQRIARVREETRQLFLSEKFADYTHLLWLDADIIPEKDSLSKLVEHNTDIVSGVYQCRSTGEAIIPMLDGKDATAHIANSSTFSETDRLYKCNGFGMGFMLVSRKALESVSFRKPEYFKNLTIGEDWRWCLDAEEAGFSTYVDTTVHVWHCERDLASRIVVEDIKEGAVWKGPGWQIQNDHGVFTVNVPKTNLSKKQLDLLRENPEIYVMYVRDLKLEKADLKGLLESL